MKTFSQFSPFCPRRNFVLATALALCFITAGVHAQSHDILYPCLVDLPGWKGEAPDGMKLDMGGMKMINAHRQYTQGDKEINAIIIIGNPQMAGVATPPRPILTESSRKVCLSRLSAVLLLVGSVFSGIVIASSLSCSDIPH